MRLHGENELMFGEQRILQSVIDSLTARIAIIDNNGEILLVNKEWSRFACVEQVCVC